MDTETLTASTVGTIIIRVLGAPMESRFRHRLFPPDKIQAEEHGLRKCRSVR